MDCFHFRNKFAIPGAVLVALLSGGEALAQRAVRPTCNLTASRQTVNNELCTVYVEQILGTNLLGVPVITEPLGQPAVMAPYVTKKWKGSVVCPRGGQRIIATIRYSAGTSTCEATVPAAPAPQVSQAPALPAPRCVMEARRQGLGSTCRVGLSNQGGLASPDIRFTSSMEGTKFGLPGLGGWYADFNCPVAEKTTFTATLTNATGNSSCSVDVEPVPVPAVACRLTQIPTGNFVVVPRSRYNPTGESVKIAKRCGVAATATWAEAPTSSIQYNSQARVYELTGNVTNPDASCGYYVLKPISATQDIALAPNPPAGTPNCTALSIPVLSWSRDSSGDVTVPLGSQTDVSFTVTRSGDTSFPLQVRYAIRTSGLRTAFELRSTSMTPDSGLNRYLLELPAGVSQVSFQLTIASKTATDLTSSLSIIEEYVKYLDEGPIPHTRNTNSPQEFVVTVRQQ